MKVFWCEPTGQSRRFLRRYASSSDCGGGKSYHDAMAPIDDVAPSFGTDEHGARRFLEQLGRPEDFAGDPRWPVKCEACAYNFAPEDNRQIFSGQLYRRADTGVILPKHELQRTPGAMWDAWWYPVKGPDGQSLVVVCPDGREWLIDSRASNCTMKEDDVHRCWIQHGEPPVITVDKAGHTCAAGGGSIDTGTYHGFLRNGEFIAC